MTAKRYVKQNASGSWDVLKEGHRRSAIQAPSEQKAVARASHLVQSEGGGHVQVMNEMGKVMDTRKITGRTVKATKRAASGSTLRKSKRR